ncbi:MAG: polysaccharide deacetylase family protein, partial [Bilophila sp.]
MKTLWKRCTLQTRTGLLLFLLALPLSVLAQEPVLADLWPAVAGHTSADSVRAIQNNTAPPDRLTPRLVLPPLSEEEEGTIRRVELANADKVVALTFDLCELVVSTSGYDAGIVDFLREKQLPATFFVGGKWMRTHAERTMQLMLDPKFELGNHAWTHGNLGIMAEPARRDQIL